MPPVVPAAPPSSLWVRIALPGLPGPRGCRVRSVTPERAARILLAACRRWPSASLDARFAGGSRILLSEPGADGAPRVYALVAPAGLRPGLAVCTLRGRLAAAGCRLAP